MVALNSPVDNDSSASKLQHILIWIPKVEDGFMCCFILVLVFHIRISFPPFSTLNDGEEFLWRGCNGKFFGLVMDRISCIWGGFLTSYVLYLILSRWVRCDKLMIISFLIRSYKTVWLVIEFLVFWLAIIVCWLFHYDSLEYHYSKKEEVKQISS